MKLWMTRTYDVWNSSEPTNSEDTEFRPCLVNFEKTLYCFYLSKDLQLNYMKLKSDRSWTSSYFVAPFFSSDTEISATHFKGFIFLAIRPADNKLQLSKHKTIPRANVWEDVTAPSGEFIFQVNLVVYKGKLYLFGASKDSGEVKYCNSSDGKDWSAVIPVNYGGEKIATSVSPQVVTYQGLLYLVYKDREHGYYWMKFDGAGWSHPVKLTDITYNSSPGLVVHNGLLKAIFSDRPNLDESIDKKVYEYTFNGNCWSLPMPSTMVATSKGVGIASFDGKLYTVYLGTG